MKALRCTQEQRRYNYNEDIEHKEGGKARTKRTAPLLPLFIKPRLHVHSTFPSGGNKAITMWESRLHPV